jgi:predicted CopG family antitoxin
MLMKIYNLRAQQRALKKVMQGKVSTSEVINRLKDHDKLLLKIIKDMEESGECIIETKDRHE